MGRLEGRVAFVTGAARGQGRSHCVRLAAEGARVVAVDACADVPTVPYPLATEADLAETARHVEEAGGRAVTRRADVRDRSRLQAAVDDALAVFGTIDVVCANAGVISYGTAHRLSEAQWADVVDVDLTGVWRTVAVTVRPMIAAGRGGSMVLTSSTAGLKGLPHLAHYSAAKHGVVGLMRALAVELAPHGIRVNSVHPTSVDTPIIANDATYRLFRPDLDAPTRADAVGTFQGLNALDVPWLEPADISDAVAWLASDDARHVTGAAIPVDAGALL